MMMDKINESAMQRFKKRYVELSQLHLEVGLEVPISEEKAAYIVTQLKKPQVLKRLLNRKKDKYQNDRGEVRYISPALRAIDLLQVIYLDDSMYSNEVFFEKQQVIKYFNLWLRDQTISRSKRSLKTQDKKKNDLAKQGWFQQKTDSRSKESTDDDINTII
jgi:hypothetical protein